MRANITLSPRQLFMAVAVVAGGGATGTLLRDLLLRLQSIPSVPANYGWTAYAPLQSGQVSPFARLDWTYQVPWMLLAINAAGVFLATRLLRGPLRQHDPNNTMRLLLITGFFGGFTSYSSLYVALAAIWHLSILASILVALGAILSGAFAAWVGLGGRRR